MLSINSIINFFLAPTDSLSMDSPPTSRMASRHSSTTSNASNASSTKRYSRPSVKAKPLNLQGSPVTSYSEDHDYLNDNLLEEGDEDVSVLESPRASRQTSRQISPQITRHGAESNRLIIAIDYGTTFTGVAFATHNSDTTNLKDIEVIDDWGQGMKQASKVPSVFTYSPVTSPSDQQWGSSISEDAVTMINTKMELDVQDNKLDELELILQVLEGTCNLNFDNVKKSRGYPEYSWKDPEEIVTDYLTKVFHVTNEYLLNLYDAVLSTIAVDIVVTVPVNWSYRAKNSTFRAIQRAGFNQQSFSNLNNIMLITEPEAAAVYTARHLKEDKKTEFLKLGECFILCDAGGGTVDCVSYKVTQLEPTLEIERVTIATSAKCGSSYIDANFKRYLSRIIGKAYNILDPRNAGQRLGGIERKDMRMLIKKFDAEKRSFSGKNVQDIKITLPASLSKLTVGNKVVRGELTLTQNEMKQIFDPCIDEVVQLIQGQIQQVERLKNRVKNVFLVGGFGESQYLQEELTESLKLRKITMRRPEKTKAWTAVVRGAVIYGLEKEQHPSMTTMTACSRSYGIALNETHAVHNYNSADRFEDDLTANTVAHKQLSWLIRRGDLILSDENRVSDKEIQFPFLETNDRKFRLPIYEYPDDDDDMPDRWETGQNELNEVAVLNCDLSKIPISQFDRLQNPKTHQPYYVAYLICKIIMSGTSLDVEIRWKNKLICSAKVKDVEVTNMGSLSSLLERNL